MGEPQMEALQQGQGTRVPLSCPDDWRRLSARASFLGERIASAVTGAGVDEDRRERWCLAAAIGDLDRFERRLRFSGWDPARVEAVLADVELDEQTPLPTWTELAQGWIDALECGDALETEPRVEPTIPFAELYAPLVELARARVAAAAPAAWGRLAPAARSSLSRTLMRRLDVLCQRCFYVAYRGRGGGVASFVEWARRGGLRALLDEYPVLARFAATAAGLWIDASVELLERLLADWQLLEDRFAGPFGQVSTLATQLSDPHAGGRSVAIVEFDGHTRVVYKPRSLAIDVAFEQLLDHLNHCSDLPQLRTLTSIDRGTHGWVEFAEARPCPDAAAARRLYTRAGMLLCIVYALGGVDCHHENLVACGEQLVFIDLETMLQPPARALTGSETDADARVARRFMDSVLRSGMLPCWEVLSEGDEPVDQSGLGGGRSQIGLAPAMRWRARGAQDVVLELHVPERGFELGTNVPTLAGEALHPSDYVQEIVAGFEGMYRLLVAEAPALLAEDGALARFAQLELRYLLRPTRVYNLLLRDALRPPILRDGAEFSIAIEPLARALSKLDERPSAWALFEAEVAALERLDIPLFFARGERRSIFSSGGREAEELLPASAAEHLDARIRGLSEADLAEQVMIIRCSLHEGAMRGAIEGSACPHEGACSHEGACVHEGGRARSHGRASSGAMLGPLDRAELLDEALAIGRDIAAHAIRGEDGGAAWMGVAFMRESQRFQLRPLDCSLDRGAGGVALFLAALAHVSGEQEYAELALAALVPLRRMAAEPKLATGLRLGAGAGLGSLTYTLSCCATLLDAPELLDEASALARLITDERIAADRELDLINGAAGAILGLLALHAATGDDALLERARACADHLLAQRELDEHGRLIWRSRGRPAQTGLSHGAAGFAYALARLYAHTRAPELLAAVGEGLAFERDAFVAEQGNWKDLRPGAERACAISWCNGAPGIGLTRTALLELLDDPQLLDELHVALRSTLAAPLAAVDTPCCGNFGRLELLLRAGAEHRARQCAAEIVERARREGSYRVLRDAPPGMFAPGFMCGTAGIGYQLLRLAAPERLPSVLLWEPAVARS